MLGSAERPSEVRNYEFKVKRGARLAFLWELRGRRHRGE